MTQKGRFHYLIEELKRRRVIRVATLYVVAMWPIIQIADILSPALDLPAGAMQTLLMVFITGFPVVLVLTWLFNLTPKGLIKVQAVNEDGTEQANQRLIGKNIELLIVGGLLSIAVGLFMFQGGSNENSVNSTPDSLKLSNSVTTNKIESMAVLPFVPFSESKQDEYFADGLSEELLNVLSKIKTLRVVARTSSFAYKGVNRNIQEVGRELSVDAILEGSVRRNDVDNTIRVTAQLIDVRSGTHLWSETYDRKFEDIFKIQDEITAAVVGELKITLLGDEQKQLMAHETANPDAMVAHSMGRSELAKRTGVAIEQAENYFRKAVEYDPGYATAYASLAEAYVLSIGYGGKPRDEYREKAQTAVDKAIELDPELGLAWAAQGLIYFASDDKRDEAKEVLAKAIELNPSYAMAYMWYGSLQDEVDKRIEYHNKAMQLDPKSPVAGYNVAINFVEKGKDNEAMEVFSQIIEADPYYPGAYNLVAQINRFTGRIDQAIIQYKKSYDLGKERYVAAIIANLYIDLGDQENVRKWINIASDGAPEGYKTTLNWLEYAALLIEGDTKAANAVLHQLKTVETDDPGVNSYYRSVIANYALEDYPETINQFEMAEALRIEKEEEPFSYGQSERYAYIYTSYAYQQMEQLEKSRELAKLFNTEQERISNEGGRITSEHWYQKSLLQSIEGDEKMALITLQRAIDEGWSQPLRIAIEPILKNMKVDSNFQAILAGLEARMNLMREQLAFEESFATHWKG